MTPAEPRHSAPRTVAAPLRFISVCSGIEAASVAWHPLGWRAAWLSEIEPFPSAVLAHHYPDTPNRGDMTWFKDWPDATVDLLCGGTPCQSFSNAGLRAGLDDPRGQLMLTFGAIAARYRPRWLVWENVPGVLSSNGGRDFGSFLGLLGHIGYGFAYRVLDAQFVRVDGYGRAVPQRRQRVFVVGCLGDWRSAAAVLLERESLRGDPAPRREAWEDVAPTVAGGARKRGGYSADDIPSVAGTLTGGENMGGMGPGGRIQGAAYAHILPVSHCLNAKGGAGRLDGESETLIPTNGGVFDVAPTITAQYGEQTGQDARNANLIAFDTTQLTSAANRSNPQPGDACHPLAACSHPPAVAFGWQNAAAQGMPVETIAPTLDKSKHPAAATATAVRRLMPVECERLQGFPPIAERVILSLCFDRQSGCVVVGLQCLRWPSSVSPADGEGLTPFASTAAVDSSIARASRAPLAAVHVLPQSDGEAALISSRARSSSSANGASVPDWSRQATLPEATARSLALTLRELAPLVRSGKAASRLFMMPSTAVPTGNAPAPMFGDAIAGSAADAASDLSAGTFTTSELGRLRPISDSREATLCCSALAAIAGSIQSETLPATFSLELTVVTPYTAITYRGKPAADGPRYKALGNSWAVNCARWVGWRIAMVDVLTAPSAAPDRVRHVAGAQIAQGGAG